MKTYFCDKYTAEERAGGTSEWTQLKPAEVFALLQKEPHFVPMTVRAPMTLEHLALFHNKEYLAQMEHEWPDEFMASRYRAQGQTDAALEAINTKGCTMNLASGFHHAEPNQYLGFCMLNGLVLAHTALQQQIPSLRTAVLDLDAHFGNGCRTHAEKDKNFLHLDLQTGKFPARNAKEYLNAVDVILTKLNAWKPDLVEYNAGMDVLTGDRIGGGFLSLEEAWERDQKVFSFCKENQYPVVICLAGGYQDKAVTGHVGTFHEAVLHFD